MRAEEASEQGPEHPLPCSKGCAEQALFHLTPVDVPVEQGEQGKQGVFRSKIFWRNDSFYDFGVCENVTQPTSFYIPFSHNNNFSPCSLCSHCPVRTFALFIEQGEQGWTDQLVPYSRTVSQTPDGTKTARAGKASETKGIGGVFAYSSTQGGLRRCLSLSVSVGIPHRRFARKDFMATVAGEVGNPGAVSAPAAVMMAFTGFARSQLEIEEPRTPGVSVLLWALEMLAEPLPAAQDDPAAASG